MKKAKEIFNFITTQEQMIIPPVNSDVISHMAMGILVSNIKLQKKKEQKKISSTVKSNLGKKY
jgi:hypothetical protein